MVWLVKYIFCQKHFYLTVEIKFEKSAKLGVNYLKARRLNYKLYTNYKDVN